MTPSRGSDTAPGDLFFPVRVSRPLNKQKQISNTSNRECFCDFAILRFKNSFYLMNCLKRPTVL